MSLGNALVRPDGTLAGVVSQALRQARRVVWRWCARSQPQVEGRKSESLNCTFKIAGREVPVASHRWGSQVDLRLSTFDFRPSTFDLRLSTCDLRLAICDLRPAICDLRDSNHRNSATAAACPLPPLTAHCPPVTGITAAAPQQQLLFSHHRHWEELT